MAAGMKCLECDDEISIMRGPFAQYCTRACLWRARRRRRNPAYLARARERQRLRNRKRYPKHAEPRFCQTCNADISSRHGNALYCSACSAYQPRESRCLRCNGPCSRPRLVCEGCRKPRESGWIKWNNTPRTLEQKIELKARQLQFAVVHKKRVKAANELYRELMGEPKPPQKPPLPLLPPPHCVVCGIFITGWRKRNLCSKACAIARNRERHAYRYYREPLPSTDREIATANWVANRVAEKFRRHIKKHRNWTDAARKRRQKRDKHRTAVYAAMRELNLIEPEDGL